MGPEGMRVAMMREPCFERIANRIDAVSKRRKKTA
jgi:hypothetical protein